MNAWWNTIKYRKEQTFDFSSSRPILYNTFYNTLLFVTQLRIYSHISKKYLKYDDTGQNGASSGAT